MTDPVNHPPHYTFGGVEVIDALEAWNLPFHLANVVKYVARAGRKDPARIVEDLRKARWYLDRYIAQVERDQREIVVEIINRDPGPIRETQADREARLVASGHEADCSGGLCCENLCGRPDLAGLAARDRFLDPDPDITSDSWWQRHPLGSPERVRAVEEHNAAKVVEAGK